MKRRGMFVMALAVAAILFAPACDRSLPDEHDEYYRDERAMEHVVPEVVVTAARYDGLMSEVLVLGTRPEGLVPEVVVSAARVLLVAGGKPSLHVN